VKKLFTEEYSRRPSQSRQGRVRMAGGGIMNKILHYAEYALPDNKQRLLNIQ